MNFVLDKFKSLGIDPADQTSFEIVPFFGSSPNSNYKVDESCLSNWFFTPVALTMYDTTDHFITAEHAMMYAKAKMFNDRRAMGLIALVQHPSLAKKIGRKVEGYNEELWASRRYEIVKQIIQSKFEMNKVLREFLLSHSDNTVFVESSPFDRIWGVGLPTHEILENSDPYKWQGDNQLGFAITEVFRTLKGI